MNKLELIWYRYRDNMSVLFDEMEETNETLCSKYEMAKCGEF